jgi:hypothetical protein
MAKALSRDTIDLIIEHMRATAFTRPDGTQVPNLYPALAEALHKRCRPYLDQVARGGGKYRPLAEELPAIAEELGTRSPIKDRHQSVETTMEIVERARIDMGRGSRSELAPAMIAWLWRTDETYARGFIQRIGFELASVETMLQQTRLAPNEQFGAVTGSLFTLEGQLETARSRVVLVAQNQWHLVSTEDRHGDRYWPMILDALSRGIDVDVVAMHPEVGPRGQASDGLPNAISVWSGFIHTPEFPAQIEKCWQRLHQWGAAYRSAREAHAEPKTMGAFRAFGAYLTPVTLSVIDPENSSGVIVVSPRTSDPKAAGRPQFVIHKEDNPQGFTYYWSYVENALSDQHWVKLVG